ncbi:hypothetical protein LTR70_010074 [Exophiala xenobiotica]|uniref:Uncharacterized protein n=1 Tax=Lithohypha guttulata TaxID=1690604 RepID=A0ABR0JVS2_9EURO|nr:hypothetical protein LTR24_009952 [Lithohypha guttulata]KAK5309688.1 hypothetical protein LTR70_010074 [Exophiala xenobiotica]
MPSEGQGNEKSQSSVGMSTKPQKKVNFHFVTGNPQSEVEKRTVRTIVRSNASNRRWRQVRETQANSTAKPQIDDDNASGQPNGKTLSAGSIASDDETNSRDQQAKRRRLVARSARRQSKSSVHGLSTQSVSPMEVANLGQNYFGFMPTSNVSKQSITRMLQGTAASYAQLFPSGKNSTVSQMARDWFQQCLTTRGILHTALFCQAMRAQAVRPGWSAMSGNELMLCQTEAVHAINDKLLQAATACDDESVRIVFSLTWHGAVKQDVTPCTPKQSPLADLQSLKMFMGVIACDPVHAQGLDNILRVRGGLDKVEMPGLAFLISYGDILTSSCNLSRPTWPYGSYARYNHDAAADDEWLRTTRRVDHPLVTLGDGFVALHLWLPPERASQLQLVFNEMADYTRASHDFVLGSPIDRNRAVMADKRNSVQHSLLSLCLTEDEQFLDRDLFELCWLAGVAYSSIAVFPLAPNAARFDRIARRIKGKLGRPLVLQSWSKAPELVLWITVIGALCAIGTDDRDWYLGLLMQEIDTLGISTWRALKLRIMSFLWFSLASDADGEELWAEIQRRGRPFVWEQQEIGVDASCSH